MTASIRKLLALAAFTTLALTFAFGCSPGGVRLYSVTGLVTLKDGTPVKHGYITFHPDSKKGNASQEICRGTIRDGQYAIQTGNRDGALPGAYRVSIDAAAETDGKNPYYTKWYAHEKYLNPDRSQLTAEVVDSPEHGRYDFKLDPHPKAKKR